MSHPLQTRLHHRQHGEPLGITSVCSAHPLVIEAALNLAARIQEPVLIEATCNQVNQEGGYTGMTPADFRRFVMDIAKRVGCPQEQIILGGDHLGPNPWKSLAPEVAMQNAETLVAAYAAAGFSKLHLDTSMGCAGEALALEDAVVAQRAARLAAAAESSYEGANWRPVYVVGTEVPVPGGALDELHDIQPTTPDAVTSTHDIHRQAFADRDLEDAWSRVVAMVVQPGVEFGHTDVVHFDPARAQALSSTLKNFPGLVFEAHSTDYQTSHGLRALVEQGYAILKVGPWLSFALREALYGLDAVADILDGRTPEHALMQCMDGVMLASPHHWHNYYPGEAQEQWIQRHFSLSDRIRYYWPDPIARAAVDTLMTRLGTRSLPAPLLSQFVPALGELQSNLNAHQVLIQAVQQVLEIYQQAVQGS